MAKKKDTDIRFWGLSFPIFLISSIFCCCMYGASKIYVDNKIEKKKFGLVFDHLEGKKNTLFGEIDFSDDLMVQSGFNVKVIMP